MGAVRFIYVTVFLDVLGIGIAIPVLPALVGELSGSRELQASWYGVLGASYGLMQFLCAPLLGALSDRFGRRPILLLSTMGLGTNYLLSALAGSLPVLLLARVLGGATASSLSVASAYVADSTTPEERTKYLGLIGACFGLGFVMGPMMGGLLGSINLQLPFLVAAGLALLNTAYGFFVLPESLPQDKRRAFDPKSATPLTVFKNLSSLKAIGGLLWVYAGVTFAQLILQSTWALYTAFRFSWGPRNTGMTLFLVGLMAVIVQGGLLVRLTRLLGETRLVLLGLASGTVAYFSFGAVTEGHWLYAIIVCNLLSYGVAPTLQSIISRHVPEDEQGVTMGSLQSLASLMLVVAPLVGTTLLGQTSHLPANDWRVGGTFFLCAISQAVALGIAFIHFRRQS
jgi:DHA1 family tetracycline resistance protein-like MFS transporter